MIKTRLTDGWKVYRDKDAFSLVYTLPADAADVSVPYDAMWHEPQDQYAVSAGRTCYLDGGVYHYYKELDIPESMRGEKLQGGTGVQAPQCGCGRGPRARLWATGGQTHAWPSDPGRPTLSSCS